MNTKKSAKPEDRIKEQQADYLETPYEIPFVEFERFEVIDGIRYEMQPSPTVKHQKISGALHLMLHHTCHTTATILYAPIDLYLDEDNQFQPDLVVISHERAAIIGEKRIEGAPDLVVEILSPSTSHNDRIHKKRQYERHGLPEYWIVDPVHRTIDQFMLVEGKFMLNETYGIRGALTSPRMPCIRIDLSRLFPEEVQ